MSSRILLLTGAAALSAIMALATPVVAQSDDVDPEMQIQRLENQLRQLTGQNEELQYRNRQLEERLQALQAGAPAATPGPPPTAQPQPMIAATPGARQPGYDQIAAPRPIMQDPAAVSPGVAQGTAQVRPRGDAFDPSQNPNAPGAPLDLATAAGGAANPPAAPAQRYPATTGGLTTLPPTATPKDEFDLGIGYMQRRDYALAEETMRNFAQKYPSDPLTADSQYWLGESFFQRQLYRDAAEAFLAVTTKYDRSTKAPDALLRLGQSLAALKEKEAACAALGEVTRKYPRASTAIKNAVDKEQRRVKC